MLVHAKISKVWACMEHAIFLKVNVLDVASHNQLQLRCPRVCPRTNQMRPPKKNKERTGCPWQTPQLRHFITATTSIYTVGAENTPAAGARLALQSVLTESFVSYSCQLQDIDAQYWFSFSLHLCVRFG